MQGNLPELELHVPIQFDRRYETQQKVTNKKCVDNIVYQVKGLRLLRGQKSHLEWNEQRCVDQQCVRACRDDIVQLGSRHDYKPVRFLLVSVVHES